MARKPSYNKDFGPTVKDKLSKNQCKNAKKQESDYSKAMITVKRINIVSLTIERGADNFQENTF